MVSAEVVKQLFDELIIVGFTDTQAIEYITSLVTKVSNNKCRCEDGKK